MKASIIITFFIILAIMFFGSISYGKEIDIVKNIRDLFRNLAINTFLEERNILTNKTSAPVVVESFLMGVQDNDITFMTSLFSPSAISEIGADKFETMLISFMDYFEGDLISVTEIFGSSTDELYNDGKTYKEIRVPLEVVTTEREYRIVIKIIVQDDWNPKNEGIWSLYIIDKTKDNDNEQPYRGDLAYRTGIHIDVPRLR